MSKIALICCGSFNPITIKHLIIFEIAKDHLNATTDQMVVEGILSPAHDHYSSKKLECSEDRCKMIKLALGQKNWIRLDNWEANQQNWLPTRDVMDYHGLRLKQQGTGLKLLCGADLFETFNIPGLWSDEDIETIVGKYGMVVVTRTGYDPYRILERGPKSDILMKHRNNITIVEDCVEGISSSLVRHKIKCGQSIRYFVPDPVYLYINKHNLYK